MFTFSILINYKFSFYGELLLTLLIYILKLVFVGSLMVVKNTQNIVPALGEWNTVLYWFYIGKYVSGVNTARSAR